MSELLEILLEVAFNTIACVLEIIADNWFSDLTLPDTNCIRIILVFVLILLGAIIFWELH